MAKHPEPRHEPQPGDTDMPAPNRRERRGNKSGAPPHRGGKPTIGRTNGMVPNSREYSMRRRSG